MARFDVSGRQLLVAMEHGRALGAGADAILISLGVVARYRERLIGELPGADAGRGRSVLQVVREASNAGGRGVAFGRNIGQSLDLAKMVGALRHLIHDDGSLEQAALLLR